MSKNSAAAQVLLSVMTALLASCASTETAVPAVTVVAPGSAGAQRAQLESGRTVYVTKCARCHAPEPVAKFSASRWAAIIPEMTEDAKLSPQETEALKAYVFAAVRAR